MVIDTPDRWGSLSYCFASFSVALISPQWHEGEKHGTGRIEYANGDVYEGEWRFDVPEGAGTITYKKGGRYEGQWHEAKRHGQGTHIDEFGARYEGSW